MPVFDFNSSASDKKEAECTYEVFYTNAQTATPQQPILLIHIRDGNIIHQESLLIR